MGAGSENGQFGNENEQFDNENEQPGNKNERIDDEQQTLTAFEHFFETDIRIKEAIAEAQPDSKDLYDEASRMRYLDRAYKDFSGFEHDFQTMAREFQMGDHIKQSTHEFFERGGESFATSNFDPDTLRRIYKQRFYQLRDSFVDEVRDEAVGYTLLDDSERLIKHADSVNELLHTFHSVIMNNEEILQRIPPIEQKGEVTLRGEVNSLSNDVYQTIDDDLDIGETDIVAVDSKMLMMVRDRAHALMIEAEPMKERPGEVIIHYNIPKVINRGMVEKLPGIDRINDRNASGRFAVPETEFGERIVDFIGRVPTDEDSERFQEYMRQNT